MSYNPLLDLDHLPRFSEIQVSHFEPAFDSVLADNEAMYRRLETLSAPTWETFAGPIDDAESRLRSVWAIVSAYNAVLNSEEVRDVYEKLLGRLTRYYTDFSQNEALFKRYQALLGSEAFDGYSEAQKASIEHILRDFKLGGIALDVSGKKEYAGVCAELSRLQNRFAQNVLDATQGWSLLLEDESDLKGVPGSDLARFQKAAIAQGKPGGFLLTLDIPSYLPVMSCCENRELRRLLYRAYVTRASDQGEHVPEWDNTGVIESIMTLRRQKALMLGFGSYAEFSLAAKMAKSVETVTDFLYELADKSSAQAKAEFKELEDFARQLDGLASLEFWDVPYYSEKLKQKRYGFSKEEIRAYFPVGKVLEGLFALCERLFGVQIEHKAEVQSYHPDVSYYQISRDGKEVAGFFTDLYARQNKRGGAWLANCRARSLFRSGSIQNPLAFLVCNFTPPSDDMPCLLAPDELRTLFHEFGHCLHYTLTKVDVANVSGISNVPWDAVELPSQLLENWCWQKEVIAMISEHVDSGESLPPHFLESLRASQTFQAGMSMVRQLEFSLFDFILHRDFFPGDTDVAEVLGEVRQQVSVKSPPDYARFQHGFTHVFAGGYAAGYYSYKWAEVLAADAFSKFLEEGVMNEKVGASFREEFLELGGSRDVNDMFVAFRGRPPKVEALLQQSGIRV